MSLEQKNYLKRLKREKVLIFLTQVSLLIVFLGAWELLARLRIIDTFIFSSPSKIMNTLISLYRENNLFIHIYATSFEVIVAFLLSSICGFIIALLFYLNPRLKKILDPFITLINSMPKVALGPLIIIWMGANTKSIIFMALLINLIVTIITIHNGMVATDPDMIKLFKVFNAKDKDIVLRLIIPSARNDIIEALKLNISMSLIGLLPPVGENIFFNKCYSRY